MTTATVDAIFAEFTGSAQAGGAVAVLRRGEILHRAGYGLVNRERGLPMTPASRFRICSISKQFTCALILWEALEGKLDLDTSPRRYLPALPAFMDDICIADLCQNRSGLRDYWCLAMLTGARAETRFRREDAGRVIFGQRDTQFPPGAGHSYCNGNFTVLGWVLEAVTGQPYPDLLRERILAPLGMHDTFVPSSTGEPLAGAEQGYESAPGGGLMPALVDIHWEADAGIVSTLDDMLRWERNFAEDRLGPPGLIQRLYRCDPMRDGVPCDYAFGLRLGQYRGYPYQSHEGGLRGWRSCRIRFPTEALSVIVLFNQMQDAGAVARRVADLWLPGEAPPAPTGARLDPDDPRCGFYLDRHTGLGFQVLAGDGVLTLNFSGQYLPLVAEGDDSYRDQRGSLRASFEPAPTPVLTVRMANRNYRARMARETSPGPETMAGMTGVYRSTELQSELRLGLTQARPRVEIRGPLGTVEDWPVRAVARDVWVLECQRSLDYLPPGEFVLWRAGDTLTVSCGLAFGIRFQRVAGG